MSTRRNRGAPGALALLMLLAFSVAPPARAGEVSASGDGTEGWRKVLAYAHCAFGVFRAVTPTEWSTALFDCARLFMDEPPHPGGGL